MSKVVRKRFAVKSGLTDTKGPQNEVRTSLLPLVAGCRTAQKLKSYWCLCASRQFWPRLWLVCVNRFSSPRREGVCVPIMHRSPLWVCVHGTSHGSWCRRRSASAPPPALCAASRGATPAGTSPWRTGNEKNDKEQLVSRRRLVKLEQRVATRSSVFSCNFSLFRRISQTASSCFKDGRDCRKHRYFLNGHFPSLFFWST